MSWRQNLRPTRVRGFEAYGHAKIEEQDTLGVPAFQRVRTEYCDLPFGTDDDPIQSSQGTSMMIC